MQQIQRWDFIELAFDGPAAGNPFTDVTFGATFKHGHRAMNAAGFYDGDGVYRVRFMPDALGAWEYQTHSSAPALAGHSGQFECVAPGPDNRGPVGVRDTFHFAHADGTPHVSVGTTCYAWVHQDDALIAQTLATLKAAPFNKLRMCVFPKHYSYNSNEPALFAYARNADGDGAFDFTRFDPAFFRHLERCVASLRDMNIEADIILFHPYDRWGFAKMDRDCNHRYLRYVVARLAAYRNVWWSMANEYDLMPWLDMRDWDDFFKTVQESDPYGHLRSVHNCRGFYDHAKPWVTHCSVQSSAVEQTTAWREQYRKPVVNDECCYEGNVPLAWGNLTGEELVRRFWETVVRGGYCGHGDTFLDPDDVIWWAKGGVLKGRSAPRIAFLRSVLEGLPDMRLDPVSNATNTYLPCAGKRGSHYLIYFGHRQPAEMTFTLDDSASYGANILDTWAMTITPIEGVFRGKFTLALPGVPNQAIRLLRA